MYFPGLTLEIAEAIVSPIIDEREWIFDSSHPLVLAYENLRKVEKTCTWARRDLPEKLRVAVQAVNDAYWRTRLEDYIPRPAYRRLDMGLRGFLSVKEAVANAIEFGTNFGEKGEVKLTYKEGDYQLLAIVEDPGSGFSIPPTLAPDTHGARGKGLKYLLESKKFRFNFEKLEDKFRVFMLYGVK